MARIAFFVWPMTASIVCTLKLARDLRSKGHEISYLGMPECGRYVLPQGFSFTPLYASWFSERLADGDAQDPNSRKGFDHARVRAQRVQALLRAIATDKDREFQYLMARMKPDLLIIHSSDFEVILPSLLAFESGVKSIYLNSTLSRTEDANLPPITSSIMPWDRWSSLRIWLAWRKVKIKRSFATVIAISRGRGYKSPLVCAAQQIAARCRYPWDLVESTDTVRMKIRLPELVAWPRQLDFPAVDRPGRHYAGSMIDLDRQEPDFPWDRVDERPLIYCALGTLKWHGTEAYTLFFRVVLDVAATKPNFQWVVSLGDAVSASDFTSIPSNVVLVKQAPQLALLQRSTIAIVHGGATTVKECAYFGVPMIVFPLGYDHPGNTARVVFHGIGVRANFRDLTAEKLSALVERVEKDSFIRSEARVLRDALRVDQMRAADFVESLIND